MFGFGSRKTRDRLSGKNIMSRQVLYVDCISMKTKKVTYHGSYANNLY